MEASSTGSASCNICTRLRYSKPASNSNLLLLVVDESAKQGCSTCALIRDAVSPFVDDCGLEHPLVIQGWDLTRLRGLRIIVASVSDRVTGPEEQDQILSIDAYPTTEPENLPDWLERLDGKHDSIPQDISGDTASEESVRTLSMWIRQCDEQHLNCKAAGSNYLPTRVLDVGTQASPHLRLLKTHGQRGHYICLSHCWGGERTLCAETTTVASLQVEIPWAVVPKTFQDAIIITRKLGILYLWIDSLCILQDSTDDWRKESVNMSAYYAGSYLTIAASGSTADSEGCFSVAHRKYKGQVIESTEQDSVHTFKARTTLPHSWGKLFLPLLDRAWVLQERLLSRRVIHYTPEELIWECMERTTCECACIRTLWHRGQPTIEKNALFLDRLKDLQKKELHELWHRIVSCYSRLRLSYQKDRLPALSAAATHMQRFRPAGASYLAGLWRDSLVKDLLWTAEEGCQRPERWCAPSWSWACMVGPVQFPQGMSTEPLISIIDATSLPAGPDPNGEILSGHITVSGALQRFDLRNEGGTLSRGSSLTSSEHESFMNINWDTEQNGTEDTLDSLYCLPVAVQRAHWMRSFLRKYIMILQKVGNPVDQTYERVGLIRLSYDGRLPGRDPFTEVLEGTTLTVV